MNIAEAREEYARALRLGQKQVKERTQGGRNPNPLILEELLASRPYESAREVGLIEIPMDRIVGVATAGRVTAFSGDFMPLLGPDTEFAAKWTHLCMQHLSDVGIRDPIECFEYLGDFYVREGNKRVSVLRHFGAPRIPGHVRRLLPARTQEPAIEAYYEFLDFYKVSGLYDIRFRVPGHYSRLLAFLGKEPGEVWEPRERQSFSSSYRYFREAYEALGGDSVNLPAEEALLLWLQAYPFRALKELSGEELKKSLSGLWKDVVTLADQVPMEVRTTALREGKTGLLTRIIAPAPDHLKVAFVHQRNPADSPWTKGHEEGRLYLEKALEGRVETESYFDADTPEQTEAALNAAVESGAQLVFTTTPQLSRATLRAASANPKIRFFNCSADAPFSSVRTYYCRVYEGKFITGAIAGAMAENNRIGYVGSSPILGVPASINAFALGAQLTNPRAVIDLRWSCTPGSPVQEFIAQGIRVISNRDVPTPDRSYLEYGEYGTYLVEDNASLVPLGSPCWVWGKFYETVARAILSGDWGTGKDAPAPVNYWWGMDTGVIDVKFTPNLPQGLKQLGDLLRQSIREGRLDPFRRKIVTQDGTVINEGGRILPPQEILKMDWLCRNVEGSIPRFEELEDFARGMVRELGIYREEIPAEKEGTI